MIGGSGLNNGTNLGGSSAVSTYGRQISAIQGQLKTLGTSLTAALAAVGTLQGNGQITTTQAQWLADAIATVGSASTILTSAMGQLITSGTATWLAGAQGKVPTGTNLPAYTDNAMVLLTDLYTDMTNTASPYNTSATFAQAIATMITDYNGATHLVTDEVTYIQQLISTAQTGGTMQFATGTTFSDTLKLVKGLYDLYNSWLSQAKGAITDPTTIVTTANTKFSFLSDMVTTIMASTEPDAAGIQTGTGLGDTLLGMAVNMTPFVMDLVAKCFTTQGRRDFFEALYDQAVLDTADNYTLTETGTLFADSLQQLLKYKTWLEDAKATVPSALDLLSGSSGSFDAYLFLFANTLSTTYSMIASDAAFQISRTKTFLDSYAPWITNAVAHVDEGFNLLRVTSDQQTFLENLSAQAIANSYSGASLVLALYNSQVFITNYSTWMQAAKFEVAVGSDLVSKQSPLWLFVSDLSNRVAINGVAGNIVDATQVLSTSQLTYYQTLYGTLGLNTAWNTGAEVAGKLLAMDTNLLGIMNSSEYAFLQSLYTQAFTAGTYLTGSAFYTAAVSGGGGGAVDEIMYHFSTNATANTVPTIQNIETLYSTGSPGISTGSTSSLLTFTPTVTGAKYKCTMQALGNSGGSLTPRFGATTIYFVTQYWGTTYTPMYCSTTAGSMKTFTLDFVYDSSLGNYFELFGQVSSGEHFYLTIRKIP